MQTIAIVGAGFTGTMVTVHMLRRHRSEHGDLSIVMIERTGRFTAGVAYGTTCRRHLLNVPAGRMSAFNDDADHFLRWARARDRTIAGGTFVPRGLYGEYLAEVLREVEAAAAPNATLTRVHAQARAITADRDNRMRIHLDGDAGSGGVHADRVVLAIGNYPPADPPVAGSSFFASARYARDPWAADAIDVPARDPVLLIGTGLTMLDIALALRERGHVGTIHAISRRGLLPQPHRDSPTAPPHHDRPQTLDRWPRTALGLLKSLRAEIRDAQAGCGVDWREVVTSLRADTPALWQSLSKLERERFLRHLRPFWETHRHRAAPDIAEAIDELRERGILHVAAARVEALRETRDGVDVRLRKRGEKSSTSLRVAKVINCTGPNTDLATVPDPLVRNLHTAGWIRPDALGLGIETNKHGAVIRADGSACRRLFLVGPLRKGGLWENTAVPELRVEAKALAHHLAGVEAVVNIEHRERAHALQC